MSKLYNAVSMELMFYAGYNLRRDTENAPGPYKEERYIYQRMLEERANYGLRQDSPRVQMFRKGRFRI